MIPTDHESAPVRNEWKIFREAKALIGQCILAFRSAPSNLVKWMAACITADSAASESFDKNVQMHRWSDPFLYRATTSILHRLILSNIQISLPMPTDPSAQSCSSWRFSEAATDKKNEFAHRAWIFSLSKIAFAFPKRASAVGCTGLNLISRVTVGRCFTRFSRRPMIFSLKHLSYNFSFVWSPFFGIGTVRRLSVEYRPVARLSADDRPTHFKLLENERHSATARSMKGRQSTDF